MLGIYLLTQLGLLLLSQEVNSLPVQCGSLPEVEHGWPLEDQIGRIKVQYECDVGYSHTGSRKANRCQMNSMWTNNVECTYNSTVGCLMLTRRPGVGITGRPRVMQNVYAVGTVVQVKCMAGYYQEGLVNADIRCRSYSDGYRWYGDGVDIKCIGRTCADPGTPRYGGKNDGVYRVGDQVEFYCNRGYYRRGVRRSTCLFDRTWSQSVPVCEEICCKYMDRDMDHGVIRHSGNCFGSTANLICEEGYKSEAVRATCTEDYTWKPAFDQCTRIGCERIDTKDHFALEVKYSGLIYASLVIFSCTQDTMMVGQRRASCMGNGKWDSVPVCYKGCNVPQLKNGFVNRGGYNYTQLGPIKHGDVTTRSCNDGYVLTPSTATMHIKCYNGTWQPTEGHCMEAPCTIPYPVAEGTTYWGPDNDQYTSNIQVTSHVTIRVRCATGFANPHQTSVLCTRGAWPQVPLPQCRRVRCELPSGESHTSYKTCRSLNWCKSVHQYAEYEQEVKVDCTHGYTPVVSEATCRVGGLFEPPLEACKEVRCELPSRRPHTSYKTCTGYWSYSCISVDQYAEYDQEVKVDCGDGYTPVVSKATCKVGGLFEPHLEACKEATCTIPSTVPEGTAYEGTDNYQYASHSQVNSGDRIRASCSTGFINADQTSVLCTRGAWSPEQLPQCRRVRCELPSGESHTSYKTCRWTFFIINSSCTSVSQYVEFEQEVKVDCTHDYTPVVSKATCRADGLFEPHLEACKED